MEADKKRLRAPTPEHGQQHGVDRPGKKPRTGSGGRSKSRYWQWTKNGYTLEDLLVPGRWFEEGLVTYVIFGTEKAPTTGQKHLQGYLELRNERSLTGLKKSLGWNDVHLEIRKGTSSQNIDYCRKAGKDCWVEFGSPSPGQGNRCDLEAVRLDIRSGSYNELQLWERNFSSYVRYGKSLERYRDMVERATRTERTRAKYVAYLVGHTGTGKSSMASNKLYDKYGIDSVYIKPIGDWFTGLHSGHRAIILDEFRCDISLAVMLRLLDRYDNYAEYKGSAVNIFNVEEIWITSNYSLDALYPNKNREELKPLYRRVDLYLYFPQRPASRFGPVCTKPEDRTDYLSLLINSP